MMSATLFHYDVRDADSVAPAVRGADYGSMLQRLIGPIL